MNYAINTFKVGISSILKALLIVVLLMAIWAAASTAKTGGWWIPAEGMGDGTGYWLLFAPPIEVIDHEHKGHDHIGSEVYAAGGSVGRLRDFNGEDHYSSICDNYRNFKDASQEVSNGSRTDVTNDSNGVAEGCGVDANIGFNGKWHVAFETPGGVDGAANGQSGVSEHPGLIILGS